MSFHSLAQGKYEFKNIELPSKFENTRANAILEDSKGFMWFGFDGGLILFNGYKGVEIFYVKSDIESRSFGSISSLIEDSEGKIWIGTSNGQYIYNPKSEKSIYVEDDFINGASVRSLNKTKNDEIIIGSVTGLLIYSIDGVFKELYRHQPSMSESLSNKVIRTSYEDSDGNIWVGTYDQLNLIDRGKKKIDHFKLQSRDVLLNSNNLILSIQPIDSTNDSILAIGTETGLCLFNRYSKDFKQFNHSDTQNSISNNVVKTVQPVGNQLWLGTDLGLNIFDVEENKFTNLFYNYNDSNSISNNVINNIYLDSNRNLWVATDAGVDLIYLKSEAILINQFNNTTTPFRDGIIINGFSESENGDIWFASQQGAFQYSFAKNNFKQFLPPKILHNKVQDVLIGKNGKTWIATSGGLNIYDGKTGKITNHVSKSTGENVLKSNYLTCLAMDSKGSVWLGTANNGVFKVIENENGELDFINFDYNSANVNSLSSTTILDIVIDKNDNIWVGTSSGLNCIYAHNGVVDRFEEGGLEELSSSVNQLFFDAQNNLWAATYNGLIHWNSFNKSFSRVEESLTNFSSAAVIGSMVYFIAQNKFYIYDSASEKLMAVPNHLLGIDNPKQIELMANKNLLVTGKTGFTTFNSNDLNVVPDSTTVRWTNLKIGNEVVKPYKEIDSRFISTNSIDDTESISLNYDENSFQLEFSSLFYSAQSTVEYQYILENYDYEWKTLNDGQYGVSYTQVRPGNYTLKVKASNNQGKFNSVPKELNIKIKPPFYLSIGASFFYLITFIALILIYRRTLLKRERYRNELKLEKLEYQKSEELISLKTRFFTNITHELKTPLTLISSPIDDLLTKDLDSNTLQRLGLVKKNTDRLKKLVNQILDIRKIEAGGEQLLIQKYDITKFCNQIVNQFKVEATKREILLEFNKESESIIIWFDSEKVEKMLFNLLSNAFKFTQNKGTIRVHVKIDDAEKFVLVTVSDNGKGISKEAQETIFDRFNSLSASNYSNQKGTGIGLSLVYEYAALHNGLVEFESVENVGSKFTFSIPLNKEAFELYDIVQEEDLLDNKIQQTDSVDNIEVEIESIEAKNKTGKLKVLIVEDDEDMREFLNLGLNEKYDVLTAEDGKYGFQSSIKHLPDIIVSDLMMPNVDGLRFCKKLREDIRTSHIPFILLTAKGGVDSKIEGIEVGVDDYIQKPFNLDHLLAKMKSLIKQRSDLKKMFANQQKFEPSEVTVNSLDEKFLDELLLTIEKEIDNSALTVKLLSEIMGVSSTNLYRKIKALTGQTATEFIRNIRLKRAGQLLKNKNLNVSEVMYMVGFTHPSYFTKCFKEMYGVSPKAFSK
ncbi:hybrid sensor histidine kinase/response regulator transcription factor [Urechidicola vernalis]|uniref:histidine kinase n=1 Tax=Urechidicola vernalis TaxID=3075600 RepID=A0ABU2Y1E9_9FLAO|nr:two-component regulator propeller domain-containing protein [Urechidicola sp. P050]MDT0551832.1 two-component regulator propeller domain-containing protein [Urechidicola sp. P050]